MYFWGGVLIYVSVTLYHETGKTWQDFVFALALLAAGLTIIALKYWRGL